MIRADEGENTQVGIGLSRSWGQHIHAALEPDGTPTFVSTLGSGPENTASAQLGR
jgi:hypothetical protein